MKDKQGQFLCLPCTGIELPNWNPQHAPPLAILPVSLCFQSLQNHCQEAQGFPGDRRKTSEYLATTFGGLDLSEAPIYQEQLATRK